MNPTSNTSEKPEFTITRRFHAPRELLWRAWTEESELAQWLRPFGVSTESVSFDVRVGGTYRYVMVNDETGEEYPTGGEFLEVAPLERLVFTWVNQAPPPSPHRSSLSRSSAKANAQNSYSTCAATLVNPATASSMTGGPRRSQISASICPAIRSGNCSGEFSSLGKSVSIPANRVHSSTRAAITMTSPSTSVRGPCGCGCQVRVNRCHAHTRRVLPGTVDTLPRESRLPLYPAPNPGGRGWT